MVIAGCMTVTAVSLCASAGSIFRRRQKNKDGGCGAGTIQFLHGNGRLAAEQPCLNKI